MAARLAILVPLAILVVLLGVMPTKLILDPILQPVQKILRTVPEKPLFTAEPMAQKTTVLPPATVAAS